MPPKKPPPRKSPTNRKPPPKRTARVHSYSRRDGTKVKSHNRELAWRQARAAWTGAAISGVTTTALVFEFGFNAITAVLLVLTALFSWAGVWASQKHNGNKRKMRAAARRPAPSRTRKR